MVYNKDDRNIISVKVSPQKSRNDSRGQLKTRQLMNIIPSVKPNVNSQCRKAGPVTQSKRTTTAMPNTEHPLGDSVEDMQRRTSPVYDPPCNEEESRDYLGVIQHTPQPPANPTEAGVSWQYRRMVGYTTNNLEQTIESVDVHATNEAVTGSSTKRAEMVRRVGKVAKPSGSAHTKPKIPWHTLGCRRKGGIRQ